ncbi:MAG TPA: DUF5615 family PIN-like protein [Emticicia sp.]
MRSNSANLVKLLTATTKSLQHVADLIFLVDPSFNGASGEGSGSGFIDDAERGYAAGNKAKTAKSVVQAAEFIDDANRMIEQPFNPGMSKRQIIVDENLSPSLLDELASAGFETKSFEKGTLDASIIEYAKQNDAIVLTNNVKDFIKKGIPVIKVSENMKKDVSKIVEKMKNLRANVEAGTTDINAKNGISLINE